MKQDKKKQIDYTKEIGISQGKQPPNSVDFERLIIGTMLIDKLGLDKVLYIYGDNPLCLPSKIESSYNGGK